MPAWGQHSAWRILDTHFDAGQRFLATWGAWLRDGQALSASERRTRTLHYVALVEGAIDPQAVLAATAPHRDLLPLAQELSTHCADPAPGFHRIRLSDAQVLLTLCVGNVQTLLREQQFFADEVYLDATAGQPTQWGHYVCKALARRCRRGTRLHVLAPTPALMDALTQCGFTAADAAGTELHYNPHWQLKTTRQAPVATAAPPSTCAVIGAGLAGASVAAALARRGWQVQVLDAQDTPAAGASGLPVGLMVPHISGDDSPRSRLARAGIALMLQELPRLLRPGADYCVSGVLEQRHHRHPGAPDMWHTHAAWVKPAALVQAWLEQPGVRFQGAAPVSRLEREGDEWVLCDAGGHTLAHARHVVLANANGAPELLQSLREDLHSPVRPEPVEGQAHTNQGPRPFDKLTTGQAQSERMEVLQSALIQHHPQPLLTTSKLASLQNVRGVLSWGLHDDASLLAATPSSGAAADGNVFPPHPVNGWGSLIAHVPVAQGTAWYLGATYETHDTLPAPLSEHHRVNFEKLQTLLPAVARALQTEFNTGTVQAWAASRCVSANRLPLVGALEASNTPTLWVSTAMGSRGLSYALLCAELLAAQIGGEPLPIAASLAKHLAPYSPGK